MSSLRTRQWLLSQKGRSETFNIQNKKLPGKAKTISVASGKGGVGKTSIALKLSRMLADEGYKVLLIDCDHNLSNTALKLGLPLRSDFLDLVRAQKSFNEVVFKEGNFHLLAGCNGSLELFESRLELDKVIIDVIAGHEDEYDFIFLDSPAGLAQTTLNLNAYSDYRFVVVTPDKASITDSYSLIKILNNKYGIRENHLIVNKVSSKPQYQRMVRTLTDTVYNFLNLHIQTLGGIAFDERAVDQFDTRLINSAGSKIHVSFNKVLSRIAEEVIGAPAVAPGDMPFPTVQAGKEHDVQSII